MYKIQFLLGMQENQKYKIWQKIESVTWSIFHLKFSQELEVIKSSQALLMFIDNKHCLPITSFPDDGAQESL